MDRFNFWHNEVADMPTKSQSGLWYDLETGISYVTWLESYEVSSKQVSKKTQLNDKALSARNEAKKSGGKALRGTKKQKEWAEKIRAEKISNLTEQQKIVCCCDETIAIHAKFWIEARNMQATDIYNDILEIKRLSEVIKKSKESDTLQNLIANRNARIEFVKQYDELAKKYGF